MKKLIPEPYTVLHIARPFDSATKDGHGNPTVTQLAPVIRTAQSIHQGNRYGNSKEVVNEEHVDRIDTTLFMAVSNPEDYHPSDQVLVGGTADQGYTDGTAYWVDGEPTDDRKGPWRRYYRHFGGVVRLKRVT